MERAARPFGWEGTLEPCLFANAPTYKRWLNMNIRFAAKMAASPVSGARPCRCDREWYSPTRGLSHMARSEWAVETRGGFGELGRRQSEAVGGGADELGGNVASAAGEWV